MTAKSYSNHKPEFLRLIHEDSKHENRGMCMPLTYSILTHGSKDLPLTLINQHINGIHAVHGMITNAGGKRFWHSWIEFPEKVYDPTSDVFMDKKKYYSLVDAKPEYKLTKPQYMKLVKKYGHAGWYTKAELGK
jgi:hypothetical protein